MWITTLCNIVVYGVLYLYFKGHITTDGWRVKVFRVRDSASFHTHMPPKQLYGLLFYPIIHMLTVVPLSIARYRTFAHHHVPFAVIILVDCIYLSNGLLNVILFSVTRPYLLPHDPRPLSMVVITEPPRVVGGTCSGGLSEGIRTMARNSQVGTPTLCCFSESDTVQGSVEPLDKEVDRKE